MRHSESGTEHIPSHARIALSRSPKLSLQDSNSLYLAGKITQFIYNSDGPMSFNSLQESFRIGKLAAQWYQGMAYQIWYNPKHWHAASAFMLYARGLNALNLVFNQTDSSEYINRIKNRLIALNVNPRNYTWEFFSSNYIVYFKFNLLGKHSYVGMSSTTFEHRELNRRRKWLQLQKGRFTSCEQALRFWHSSQTYHHYVSIVVINAHSKASALANEANLIATWKPSLNSPFVNLVTELSAKGKTRQFSFPSYQNTTTHTRLWKKVRRRLNTTGAVFQRMDVVQDNHLQAWHLLFNLASYNLNSFLASKKIRGKDFDQLQLYALYRQSQHMEAPHKQKAQNLLKQAFVFRNLSIPNHNKPLALPDLAHESFGTNLKLWLRSIILKHKNVALPFHLPSHSVIVKKHRTLANCVHNWKSWALSITAPPSTCNCSLFVAKFPRTTLTEGHIMGDASCFKHLPKDVFEVLNANSSDTVYPSLEEYVEKTSSIITAWIQHHHLPQHIVTEWNSYIRSEWTAHSKAVETKWNFKKVSAFRHCFKDFVIQSEDHAPSKLCVFCPMKYFQLHIKTLADPSVFKVHSVSPTSTKLACVQQFPKVLRTRYKWGIRPRAPIPNSYIFPKRKKAWTTARPLITFYKTQFSTLWKALGKLLYDLTCKAYPHSWHNTTLPQTFNNLRRFLEKNKHDLWDFVLINDDLKGFFTSVPHERIIDSCVHMLDRYIQFSGSNPQYLKLSVNFKLPAKKPRTIQGRVIQNKYTKSFKFTDLIPLIKCCLSSSAFQCLASVHSQARGSCIGNPASPPLCNIVVAFHECIWHESYNIIRNSAQFTSRYVDNRLLILSKATLARNAWQVITDLNFYKHPVELEMVGDNHFLGFEVSLHPPSIVYIQPKENWQFRSTSSAGSPSTNLSGFESRLHAIFRYSWPRNQVYKSVSQLRHSYFTRGFPALSLNKLIRKVAKSHRSFFRMDNLEPL